MGTNAFNQAQFENELRRTLKEHWQLFVIQGVIFVLLGAAAVALPQIATVTISVFVGWILFIAGVARAASLFRASHAPGYWSSLALAVLTAILGAILALYPIQGGQTLTYVLIAYFILHGIVSIAIAFSIRSDTSRWLLLIFSGVIDLVLAAFVITGLPTTGEWVLGLYVGINLLFTGFALVFAALGARAA